MAQLVLSLFWARNRPKIQPQRSHASVGVEILGPKAANRAQHSPKMAQQRPNIASKWPNISPKPTQNSTSTEPCFRWGWNFRPESRQQSPKWPNIAFYVEPMLSPCLAKKTCSFDALNQRPKEHPVLGSCPGQFPVGFDRGEETQKNRDVVKLGLFQVWIFHWVFQVLNPSRKFRRPNKTDPKIRGSLLLKIDRTKEPPQFGPP